jgi:uncharacterized protein (DUF983 family)
MTAPTGPKWPGEVSTARRMGALVRQRCPRCCEGRVFKGVFAMNDPCPKCGLIFEREPGYFLGAMYFSYGLSILTMVPLFYGLVWLLPSWDKVAVVPLALLVYLPLIPLVFRYSRVMWIHFDRAVSPTELSTDRRFVKWRREQEAKKRRDDPSSS